MPARKLTRQDLRDAAEKYKNWGKGPRGRDRHAQPHAARGSPRGAPGEEGKVISLALNFDNKAPRARRASTRRWVDQPGAPCCAPAPTPTRACSIIMASAPPTTWSSCRCSAAPSGTAWVTSSMRTPCGTATIAARSPRTGRRNAASRRPRTAWSGAGCSSMCRAPSAWTSFPTATRSPAPSSTPPRRSRTFSSGAATSSSCVPGRWRRSSPREAGTAIPETTPGFSFETLEWIKRTGSPRSPPTPGLRGAAQ